MEKKILDQFTTLGHPQRAAIFRLLMRRFPQALPAGEIVVALALKSSTASSYFTALREAGLITQTREGTTLRYRASVEAARELVEFLVSDCCRDRPDICPPSFPSGEADMTDRKYSVLFICSGNSARSIFAETLLRDAAGARFEVYSAGTRPQSELNPLAVEMLKQKGHDISGLRAKNVAEFQGQDAPVFDFVFTVCDAAANEGCPVWEGQPLSAHWGMPDPVKVTGTLAERRLAFQQAYGALKNRIQSFVALPFATLDRISLQTEIDRVGTTPLIGDDE